MPLTAQPPFVQFVFWVLAAAAVLSSLLVIQLRDVFKAALALVLSLLAVAGLFVLLSAEFLAAAQVLIYAGAIAILIVFAVMLTRDVQQGNPSHRLQIPVGILVALLLVFILVAVTRTEWELITQAPISPETRSAVEALFRDTPAGLARVLLSDYVLPFEMVSVVLLAAIIGAIVLVRER